MDSFKIGGEGEDRKRCVSKSLHKLRLKTDSDKFSKKSSEEWDSELSELDFDDDDDATTVRPGSARLGQLESQSPASSEPLSLLEKIHGSDRLLTINNPTQKHSWSYKNVVETYTKAD